MNPAFELLVSFRCVALLYALFINELNVQVSDTRADDKYYKSRQQKK